MRPRGILGASEAYLRTGWSTTSSPSRVTAGIYALMALGMNVIWGMAGLINLGLVGFFAVGAYVSGLADAQAGLHRSSSAWRPARC